MVKQTILVCRNTEGNERQFSALQQESGTAIYTALGAKHTPKEGQQF
jgi:hypothetical protein